MNCPKGCQWKSRSHLRSDEPVQLDRIFIGLSKSGKTLYIFFQCPKCKRIFKEGHRINKLKGEAEA